MKDSAARSLEGYSNTHTDHHHLAVYINRSLRAPSEERRIHEKSFSEGGCVNPVFYFVDERTVRRSWPKALRSLLERTVLLSGPIMARVFNSLFRARVSLPCQQCKASLNDLSINARFRPFNSSSPHITAFSSLSSSSVSLATLSVYHGWPNTQPELDSLRLPFAVLFIGDSSRLMSYTPKANNFLISFRVTV